MAERKQNKTTGKKSTSKNTKAKASPDMKKPKASSSTKNPKATSSAKKPKASASTKKVKPSGKTIKTPSRGKVVPKRSSITNKRSIKDERTWAMACHLSIFVAAFVGPLIIWLLKKDESDFIDKHGKAALNFGLSLFIYYFSFMIIYMLLVFSIVGIILTPLMGILYLAFTIFTVVIIIRKSIQANNGKEGKYPLTIRIIS